MGSSGAPWSPFPPPHLPPMAPGSFSRSSAAACPPPPFPWPGSLDGSRSHRRFAGGSRRSQILMLFSAPASVVARLAPRPCCAGWRSARGWCRFLHLPLAKSPPASQGDPQLRGEPGSGAGLRHPWCGKWGGGRHRPVLAAPAPAPLPAVAAAPPRTRRGRPRCWALGTVPSALALMGTAGW